VTHAASANCFGPKGGETEVSRRNGMAVKTGRDRICSQLCCTSLSEVEGEGNEHEVMKNDEDSVNRCSDLLRKFSYGLIFNLITRHRPVMAYCHIWPKYHLHHNVTPHGIRSKYYSTYINVSVLVSLSRHVRVYI
jgi:hypothetical protein